MYAIRSYYGAGKVNQERITGKGVLVATPDTGFYAHKFYEWRGYNYNRTIAEDAVDVELDEYGHGTAEAANIFSAAVITSYSIHYTKLYEYHHQKGL